MKKSTIEQLEELREQIRRDWNSYCNSTGSYQRFADKAQMQITGIINALDLLILGIEEDG